MPRKNKRKSFTRGKEAMFYDDRGKKVGGQRPECKSCAFAGYGGVCKASDEKCLLGKGAVNATLQAENAGA